MLLEAYDVICEYPLNTKWEPFSYIIIYWAAKKGGADRQNVIYKGRAFQVIYRVNVWLILSKASFVFPSEIA